MSEVADQGINIPRMPWLRRAGALAAAVLLTASCATARDAVESLGGDPPDAVTDEAAVPVVDGQCPINGAIYPAGQRQWETTPRRPIGVIVENHKAARPQTGINDADAVYEAVSEGDITRMAVVKYCLDSSGLTGPVRSMRMYFLDAISELGESPLLAHIGGAGATNEEPSSINAIRQISDYGWLGRNDFDGNNADSSSLFARYPKTHPGAAVEHTSHTRVSDIWATAAQRGLTNVDSTTGKAWDEEFVPYTFKDGDPLEVRPASQVITIPFGPDNKVDTITWTYDRESNTYLRSINGVAQIDTDTGEQISTTSLEVQYLEETRNVDAALHTHHGTVGTGRVIVVQNGTSTEGTWEKTSKTGRLQLIGADGKAIPLVRGRYWVSAVASDDTGVLVSP